MDLITHDCGAKIPQDSTICPSCGRPFFYSALKLNSSPESLADSKNNKPEEVSSPLENQSSVYSSTVSLFAPRYCQTEGCGLEIPPGASTCPFCGAPAPEAPIISTTQEPELVSRKTYAILPDGSEYRFADDQTVVLGRESPNAAISSGLANSLGVSRNHATLRLGDNQLTVTDMHSTNGTWLDGIECTPSQTVTLENRHVIRLGQSASIIVFNTTISRSE